MRKTEERKGERREEREGERNTNHCIERFIGLGLEVFEVISNLRRTERTTSV
jgi:hypothetical protein